MCFDRKNRGESTTESGTEMDGFGAFFTRRKSVHVDSKNISDLTIEFISRYGKDIAVTFHSDNDCFIYVQDNIYFELLRSSGLYVFAQDYYKKNRSKSDDFMTFIPVNKVSPKWNFKKVVKKVFNESFDKSKLYEIEFHYLYVSSTPIKFTGKDMLFGRELGSGIKKKSIFSNIYCYRSLITYRKLYNKYRAKLHFYKTISQYPCFEKHLVKMILEYV